VSPKCSFSEKPEGNNDCKHPKIEAQSKAQKRAAKKQRQAEKRKAEQVCQALKETESTPSTLSAQS